MTSDTGLGRTEEHDRRLRFLGRMIEIRLFEEEVQHLFDQDLVRGSTHLCSGQEAVVVGACGALKRGDSMLCTYRGHGAVLAMGAPLDGTFAEILGRDGGLCAGKGGSMHLADVSVGAYGSFATVGAHLPIALGFGFAARYRATDEVCLCFFGDGAVNIGAFHEALNLASLWKLPVIFVCENNLYGEYSPLAATTPIAELFERARSYAMPGRRIDGNDVDLVHAVIGQAVERARRGEGPTLVEAMTYRHKGHSRSDPATYRPREELERWLALDPIVTLEQRLSEGGTELDLLREVRRIAEANVQEALENALSWPAPKLDSRFDHIYA